jgi:hypothetical protein
LLILRPRSSGIRGDERGACGAAVGGGEQQVQHHRDHEQDRGPETRGAAQELGGQQEHREHRHRDRGHQVEDGRTMGGTMSATMVGRPHARITHPHACNGATNTAREKNPSGRGAWPVV